MFSATASRRKCLKTSSGQRRIAKGGNLFLSTTTSRKIGLNFVFAVRRIAKKLLRPVTMETRCFHQKIEFKRYPRKDFCTARYEHKSSIFFFQTFKTPKKIIPGPILGQDRPEKNSAKCWFEAAIFRVLGRHRSTKPTTAP